MKKNIIYFITGLEVGGAEMMLLKLLKSYNREYNFVVVSLRDKGILGEKIEALDIPVIALNLSLNPLSLIRIFKLVLLLRSYCPDVFHSWMYHANLFSFFISIFFPHLKIYWGIRQTLYDLDKEKFLTSNIIYLNRYFSSYCDQVIFNSKKSYKQHIDFGFSAQNSIYIPNGFDTESYSLKNITIQKLDKKAELSISSTASVVGMFARYHPMKGHEVLINSALKVLENYPETVFLFAGKGLKFSKFKSLIPYKNKESFHFLGPRDDIPELLSILDISVNSSLWGEAFSNSIGEAMLMEVPLIVTDIGDSSFIVGNSAFVVKPNNVDELSLKIIKMLSLTPHERSEMGRKGRKRIIKNFSIKDISNQYKSLY